MLCEFWGVLLKFSLINKNQFSQRSYLRNIEKIPIDLLHSKKLFVVLAIKLLHCCAASSTPSIHLDPCANIISVYSKDYKIIWINILSPPSRLFFPRPNHSATISFRFIWASSRLRLRFRQIPEICFTAFCLKCFLLTRIFHHEPARESEEVM